MTSRNQAGSSGGRGNEGGSLHRSGVAAYLAAHGLVGRGLEAAGHSEDGPPPTTISFETGEAVDDLRCELKDGTALLLQAKRTCGDNRFLSETVAQWVRQAPDLLPRQWVGLVTGHPQGPVRHLGSALARRRRPVKGPFLPGEQDALAAVRKRTPTGTEAAVAERVLDAAIVLTVAAETALDPDFRYAASLLDGVVVPTRSGSKAIDALQQAFRKQAVAGTGGGIDEWLNILADAGLEVFADADGPAGPRRRAELDALAAYRKRLADCDGLLEYAMLRDDLPPLRYSLLAESIKVSVARPGGHRDHTSQERDHQLLDIARRWPRMLLTGLPGTGKSTALKQLAARWAAEPRAPIPVLIHLPEIAKDLPRGNSDITLPLLIRAATAKAPAREQEPIRRVLEQAVASSDAVLLLDSLDECYGRKGVIADGLAAIAGALPADTGLVLTTRASGIAAARKLHFPEVSLVEPDGLNSVLRSLLRHVASHRGIPAAELGGWVEEREQWIDDTRRDSADLWRIPLLATLVTLKAAYCESAPLPATRAQLLADTVLDAVKRWELTRASDTGAVFHQPMREEMLVDGFREIGHVLVDVGSRATREVRAAVAAMLTDIWGLSRGETSARAEEILRFWDEHVGVFVKSPVTGDIQPRSRIFAEIGDAMWVSGQYEAIQHAWVASALASDDRREPVILAVGISPDIARILVDTADTSADRVVRSRAALWAADAVADGAALDDMSLSTLMSQLVGLARDPTEADDDAPPGSGPSPLVTVTRSGGPGWPYARRVAALRLPSALRSERQALLRGLCLGDEQRLIGEAMAAISDAAADSRDVLHPNEAEVIRRLLARPIPDNQPGQQVRVSRRYTKHEGGETYRLLPGHHDAAEAAITFVPQLGSWAADVIFRIARHGSAGGYRRVVVGLDVLGYHDPERQKRDEDFELLMRDQTKTEFWDGWDILFEAAASCASAWNPSRAERWRLADLLALTDLLDPAHATLDDINVAFTAEKELLPAWIRVVGHAADLNLHAVAGQAMAVLTSWRSGDPDVMDPLFAPPPSPLPVCDITRLNSDEVVVLVEALGARSGWIADVAYNLLLPAQSLVIGRLVAGRIAQMPAMRRPAATRIAITNNDNPVEIAQRMLGSADSPTRIGTASAAVLLASQGQPAAWAAIIARAQADEDMTVQFAAGQKQEIAMAATYWSCADCGEINDMDKLDCKFCNTGTRPGDHWPAPET